MASGIAACGFSSPCEAGCVSVLVVLSVGFSSSCEGGRVSALVVLIVFASSLWEAGRDFSALVVLRWAVSRLSRSGILAGKQLGSALCTAHEELSLT